MNNKNNGVMLLKDSRPEMIGNLIQENSLVGLFIRDKSKGIIKNNNI